MTQITCRFLLFLCATALGSAAGCVYSTQPLSDAKSSTPDLRLLGTWEIVDPSKPDDRKTVFVRRNRDQPNVLRIFDIAERETTDVFLTKLGDEYVASISHDENGKKIYFIGKYEWKDD